MKVRLILIVVAGVVIAGTFFAGYAAAGFTGEGLPGVANQEPSPELLDEVSAEFDIFWETWDRLQETYYEGPRDVAELVRGATRGMVASIGDPHTVYVDADLARLDRERLEGSFDGIGATVELDDNGHLRIVRPLPGSPAESVGIQAGDVVISVDGLATRGRDLADIIKQVRGPRGTEVVLTIRRAGEPEPLTFTVVRDEIVVPSVISDIVDGYGYVRLTTFGAHTADDLRTVLRDFRNAGVLGIILDLRNNPGGFLESAIDVSSEFVPRNTILVRENTRDEGERIFRSSRSPTIPDLPIAVLINGGSASASEIIAGVIRDYDRGVLIGETTFGKGSVQIPYSLSDESVVRVTVAIWLTPDGQHLDGEGIAPDFDLAFNGGELGTLDDNYIRAAIGVLEGGSCCENYVDAA
jgi:carboxyl-terminal processing protease